jgi:dipeptidyl aminopeptidase/acylaminoacyl peptidase
MWRENACHYAKIESGGNRMKHITILILFVSISLYADSTRTVGNLVLDGVPEIPETVFERLNQYQNVRSALFQDWDPSSSGLLILTRFGNTNQVHYVPEPGGYRRQITFLEEPVSIARYNPNKERNGFLYSSDKGGGEFFQFYWFDFHSGRSTLLTDGGKSYNTSPVWSNSGKFLAFSSTKRNGKDFDLYVMTGTDPATIRMIKQVEGAWYPIDWNRNDTLLLVQQYISVNESYLFTLDPASGQLTPVNPKTGKKIAYETAAFSMKDDTIFYSSDEDSEFKRLTGYDPKTGKKEVLSENIPWNVESLDVSPDGKWIVFVTNEGGLSKLYLASTDRLNEPVQMELPSGVISRIKFDHAGTRLGFQISTAQSPSDVFVVDLQSRKPVQWTHSETGGLNPETFVTPELIHYPTFDTVNGKPRMIPAFYYKPKGDSKKPFPVVIRIHGGPESQTLASFSPVYQYWINELGVAVLDPNVRGSDGYGKNYLLLDNAYKREDSVKDIGKLLDWIATRPELDAKKVGLYGGSYGGYMVLSSAFHFGDRLKCAVDIVGISSFVTFLKTTESYRQNLRRAEYGDERDPKMHDFLLSISPIQNANKIDIPLFVVQGKNDPRVPVTEAEQIVKEVRKNGGDVWYLLATDEGHGFRKKDNRDHYEAAVSLFYQKYLLQ